MPLEHDQEFSQERLVVVQPNLPERRVVDDRRQEFPQGYPQIAQRAYALQGRQSIAHRIELVDQCTEDVSMPDRLTGAVQLIDLAQRGTELASNARAYSLPMRSQSDTTRAPPAAL